MKSVLLALLAASAASANADILFAAREIVGFNLMNLANIVPGGGEVLCLANGGNCPNIAAFESGHASSSVSGTGMDNKADFIASMVSTIGVPSNVLAYYTSEANWGFTASASALEKMTKGDFSGMFKASASAQVMAYAFDEMFEFRSKDGSGVFKVGDEVVSTLPFYKQKWNQMVLNTDGKVTTLTASTNNGKDKASAATFAWKIASEFTKLEDGSILTPNSTKVDVTMNYPFADEDTFLGLRMTLASAQAAAAFACDVQASVSQATAGETYVSWIGTADVGGTASPKGTVDVNVYANSTDAASYFGQDGNGNSLLATLKDTYTAGAKADVKLTQMYFSFPAKKSTGQVFWDPAIGYGANPAQPTGLSGAAIGGIVVGAVALVVVGYVAFINCNKKPEALLSSGGYASHA